MTAAAMTTDTAAGLLRAVLVDPADDLPRLVYADYLEENARAVPCGRCGSEDGTNSDHDEAFCRSDCPACDGTGVTCPDRDRAEFVRVQCELARLPDRPCVYQGRSWPNSPPARCALPNGCDQCRQTNALRRRERELLAPNWNRWLREVGPWTDWICCGGTEFSRGFDDMRVVVRRGFVAEVTCTAAAFLGGVCERCNGDGKAHGADRPFEWSASADYGKCVVCRGTGRTPGIAADLFRSQPVERVTLSDREPYLFGDGDCGWYDADEQTVEPGYEAALIPGKIWGLLADYRYPSWYEGRLYCTRQAALAALSAAAVAYGRSLAGLSA